MNASYPDSRAQRRLDIALASLLLLTGATWFIFDGAVAPSTLALAVFGVTTTKALVVMITFMELPHGPRWAFISLGGLFVAIAAALAMLLS